MTQYKINNIIFSSKNIYHQSSEVFNIETGYSHYATPSNNANHMKFNSTTKSFYTTQHKLSYNNLLGAYAPFIKVFVIRGIGYQADIIEKNSVSPEFPFKRYLSLRVGHSFLICKPIPNYIGIKVQKKDRKLIIYGNNKEQVSNFSKTIYKLRPPSVYTGRGIRIKKGLHRRKLGKKDIRKGKV